VGALTILVGGGNSIPLRAPYATNVAEDVIGDKYVLVHNQIGQYQFYKWDINTLKWIVNSEGVEVSPRYGGALFVDQMNSSPSYFVYVEQDPSTVTSVNILNGQRGSFVLAGNQSVVSANELVEYGAAQVNLRSLQTNAVTTLYPFPFIDQIVAGLGLGINAAQYSMMKRFCLM